jgi:transcription elongation factor S-II
MSSLSTVQVLKRSLSKHISSQEEGGGGNDYDAGAGASSAASPTVEAMNDLLDRLDECDMTLDVLTETLVGTVVSKLKGHAVLGDKARALIKKWKAVAKNAGAAASGDATSSLVKDISIGSSASVATAKPSIKPTKSNLSSSQSAPPTKKRSSSSSSLVSSTSAKPSAAPPAPRLDRRGSAASTGSIVDNEDEDDPSVYWSDLPEQRRNICQKLNSVLLLAKPKLLSRSSEEQEGGDQPDGVHADALPHLIGQRAAEIEEAIHVLYPHSAKSYADKARSLFFNLKKNVELSASVVLGTAGISPHDLVSMTSEQLASDDLRTARLKEAQKVIDSKRLDWEQANEDKINEMCGIKGDLLRASLFTCGRCKSTKTTSTQKQTRSADEPMTVFVLCINCGKRWKC